MNESLSECHVKWGGQSEMTGRQHIDIVTSFLLSFSQPSSLLPPYIPVLSAVDDSCSAAAEICVYLGGSCQGYERCESDYIFPVYFLTFSQPEDRHLAHCRGLMHTASAALLQNNTWHPIHTDDSEKLQGHMKVMKSKLNLWSKVNNNLFLNLALRCGMQYFI